MLQDMLANAVIVALDVGDRSAFEFLEDAAACQGAREMPLVLFPNRTLTAQEAAGLKKAAENGVIRIATSLDRLVDEVTLLLHEPHDRLPEAQRQVVSQAVLGRYELAGRTVLIVDDDVRNIFALTSVPERQNLKVFHAETGRRGIEVVKNSPSVDLVLMDVMMPERDGPQTIQAIRKMPRCKWLPIVALTVKAMKGDREMCLQAGASDHIAKPVDLDQLFSLLRVSLPRQQEVAQPV